MRGLDPRIPVDLWFFRSLAPRASVVARVDCRVKPGNDALAASPLRLRRDAFVMRGLDPRIPVDL